MATVDKYLQATKAQRSITVREMAQLASVDQSQLSQWLNGKKISPENIHKLVDGKLITREQGIAALGLGPAEDAA